MRPASVSRRIVVVTVVAGVVTAGGVAGAWAGGIAFAKHAPVAVAVTRNAPVWIAGGARQPAAARPQPSRQHAAPAAARRTAPAAHPAARASSRPKAKATRAIQAGASVSFDLCAKAAVATMPDGSTAPIWGFGLETVPGDLSTCVPSLPGPVISAQAGDTVTLNVTNDLPAGHTLSVEAPGVDFAAGPQEAAVGTTVSVSFTATEGTYLYRSAGDYGRQQTMGLYGVLVVHSATAGQADGVPVDAEQVLVLSEVDPAFNAAPDTFNMHDWAPKFWLINGKGYPSTDPIAAPAGRRLLLRWANAGADNNTMTLLGLHQRLLARDGYPLANPFDVSAETFASGNTMDGLVTIPAGAASGTRYPIYNSQLHDGMTTVIQVS